tara:strand:+ start:435 stop:2747 length:2313 start_codon:yes stop_codon:yes gene_type:complete
MIKYINKILISRCINNPLLTLLLSLSATIIISTGIIYVEQDDDMVNLLPEEIGSRKIFEEIQNEYGLTEYMYVAIGNKDKSILNKNDLNTIAELSNKFKSLDIVDDVISITNLDKIFSDPSDSSIVIDDLFEFPILNNLDIDKAVKYLNDNPIIKKRVISKNNNYANIIIIPENIDRVYVQLAQVLHDITKKYENKYELSFGGQAYVTGAVPAMVAKEVKILLLFGLLLMGTILLINLRNIKAVLLILFTIFSSLLSMFGFMGWVYHFTGSNDFYFTLMNTSMPIVLLTIANSDGVHVLSRFFKEFRKSKNSKVAIENAMNNLFLPILLTSITTSVAFLMLIFSPVSAMIGYGITIAFGIMWAWFLSNTALPSLIMLLKWDPNSKAITQPGYIEKLMQLFGRLVKNNPKKVLSIGISITIFSLIGLFLITVEVQYTKMFKKGNIIRDSAEFLDDHLMGNVNVILRVTSDDGEESLKTPQNLKDIEKIQTYLDSINYVTSTISVIDIVKQMHKTIEYENEDYYTIPNSQAKINNIFTMYEYSGGEDLSSLINDESNQGIITGLMKTFSTIEVPGLVEDINKFIDENIYTSNKNLKFELTGMMIFIVDFIWLVIKSSAISIALSLLAIFSISTLFFKSWRYGIMSIIPLTSAIILNFGLMGWFGIELTHLTAILSSIILGVGVDFSIHYITEYQRIKRENKLSNISEETIDHVGYPIILDAWSNMAFGALLLSTIIPLAQIGGLMIFAMLSTSIGALTLLASVLEIFKLKMR